MINIDNQEEKKEMVHVCILVQTEYDIDPATGNPVNVVSKVVPGGNVVASAHSKAASKSKKPKVTLESIAEQYPVISLAKSYYKMNKKAASVIGVMNEAGEMTNTVLGNRIRLQLTYIVDPTTKVTRPVIMRDDEEKLVGAQQVRDALSVSCSGQPNSMFSQFGQYFHVTAQGEGDNEIYLLDGYSTLLDLLKAIGAEIPEELRGEELVDVNEEPAKNMAKGVNGADSEGEEFIPDEIKKEQTEAVIDDDEPSSPERPAYVDPNDILAGIPQSVVDELGDIDINDI